MDRSKTAIRLTMFVVMGITAATASTAAIGATYYVDSTSGHDTAAGTDTTHPWQTLGAVNATTFSAGDQILFKRGGTWSGQLHPQGNGAAGSPIIIDAYGSGASPIINGGSLTWNSTTNALGSSAAVYLQNQQYWVIQNLEIVNDSNTDNFGTSTYSSSTDSYTYTGGYPRYGILVDNNGANLLSGITIHNNNVHDVNGCFDCNNLLDPMINGGIVVYAQQGSGGFANVAITGNTVHDLGRTGILFWDARTPSAPSTTIVQSNLSTGVIVDGNTVSNIDSSGVVTFGTEGVVLQRNIVGHAGQKTLAANFSENSAVGLWPTRAMDSTVQYNEVYGTLTQDTDGQGFDVDVDSTNTKVQYNYSHDNQGGFLLMMGQNSSNLAVRYNLSVNDSYGGTKGVFTFSWGTNKNAAIYNNTVYIPSGSSAQPIYCDPPASKNSVCATDTGAWTFQNNVIENLGSGGYVLPNTQNAVIDRNVFYGNHPVSEPSGTNKSTLDPQLVAPASPAPSGIGSVSGFQLASTSSPAAGSGGLIGENGGIDYFSRPLSATMTPSRGFHEVQNFPKPVLLADNANDWLVSAAHTANMILDTSSPANANGDGSRYSRSDSNPGSVVWSLNNMQSFSASIYEFNADLSTLTFSASPDGSNWATMLKTCTPQASTQSANGWYATTCTGSVPSGTQFLRATISNPTAWAIELGAITISM